MKDIIETRDENTYQSDDSEGSPHPVDFSRLRKGMVIPHEEIERIYSVKRSDVTAYSCAQMQLVRAIKVNTDLYPRIKKDTVEIMTDAQADAYSERRVEKTLHDQIRLAGDRVRIDQSRMTPSQQRLAEHNDRHSWFLADQARKALAAERRNRELLAPHIRIITGEPDEEPEADEEE